MHGLYHHIDHQVARTSYWIQWTHIYLVPDIGTDHTPYILSHDIPTTHLLFKIHNFFHLSQMWFKLKTLRSPSPRALTTRTCRICKTVSFFRNHLLGNKMEKSYTKNQFELVISTFIQKQSKYRTPEIWVHLNTWPRSVQIWDVFNSASDNSKLLNSDLNK